MPRPEDYKSNLESKVREMPPGLAKIAKNGKLHKALAKLSDDERAQEAAKRNPRRWLEEQGVEIPANVEVETVEGSWWYCWKAWDCQFCVDVWSGRVRFGCPTAMVP